MKISGLVLVTAALCLVVRGQVGVLAMVLSLTCCVIVYGLAFHMFQPILDLIKRLQKMTGLEDAVTAPVLKVVGICFVSRIASTVCEDSGETALSKAVDIGSTMAAFYASLPLMHAVLNVLEQILGGNG